MTIDRILLDMDGVLSDWTGAACRLFDRDPADVYANWPEGCWDITKALGVSGAELWRRVDSAGFYFWAELEAYPWVDELLELCQATAPTTILTSPSRDPQSLAGKLEWMQRRWGLTFRDYLVGPDKLACARPGALIIDDRPATVDGFREAGGAGVLFPAAWNGNRGLDPMAHVREALADASASSVNSPVIWARDTFALTRRETDVLIGIEAGHSLDEIATVMKTRKATVKWHLHNVMAKMNVETREGVLRALIRKGSR